MRKIITLLFLASCAIANAQNTNKLIKEKNVARIISTLAADNMMGRSAKAINEQKNDLALQIYHDCTVLNPHHIDAWYAIHSNKQRKQKLDDSK